MGNVNFRSLLKMILQIFLLEICIIAHNIPRRHQSLLFWFQVLKYWFLTRKWHNWHRIWLFYWICVIFVIFLVKIKFILSKDGSHNKLALYVININIPEKIHFGVVYGQKWHITTSRVISVTLVTLVTM